MRFLDSLINSNLDIDQFLMKEGFEKAYKGGFIFKKSINEVKISVFILKYRNFLYEMNLKVENDKEEKERRIYCHSKTEFIERYGFLSDRIIEMISELT